MYCDIFSKVLDVPMILICLKIYSSSCVIHFHSGFEKFPTRYYDRKMISLWRPFSCQVVSYHCWSMLFPVQVLETSCQSTFLLFVSCQHVHAR